MRTSPRRSFRYFWPVISAVLLVYSIVHVLSNSNARTETVRLDNPPALLFAQRIAALATVEPAGELMYPMPPVAGIIVEVCARSGTQVACGDPLLRLEDRHLQSALDLEEKSLMIARARLARLRQLPRDEERRFRDARVEEAEAIVRQRRDQFERVRTLHEKRVISQSDLTHAEESLSAAQSQSAAVRAERDLVHIGAWEADVQVAEAEVGLAESRVRQAALEIQRRTVRAPCVGTVLRNDFKPGDFVDTNARKERLILGDVATLHLRVEIPDDDIPRFRSEAAAIAVPRGNASLSMTLEFIRLEPLVEQRRTLNRNAEEIVDRGVLPVIYRVIDPAVKLFVGQQCEVFIDASRDARGRE